MGLMSLVIAFTTCLAFSQQPSLPPLPGPGAAAQRPQPAQAQEVKPEDYGVIEGKVLDSVTGQPLSKAQLTLFRDQGGRQPLVTSSDSSGAFVFRNVEPGSYYLSASRNRYARQSYGQRSNTGRGAVINLSARQKISDIVLRLAPGAIVTGRVVDEDGEPLPYVRVSLMQYRYTAGRRQLAPAPGGGSSNDLGEYRIFGIPPGRYYVSATRSDYAMGSFAPASGPGANTGYPTVYYPGVFDPTQTSPLVVKAGEEKAGIDFRIVRTQAVRISGRVIDPSSNRLGDDIGVVLLGRSGAASFVDRRFVPVARESGKFEIRGVSPGSYELSAFSRAGASDSRSANLRLEVGSANLENLELVLGHSATLQGVIKVEGGTQPAPSLDDLRVLLASGVEQFGRPWSSGSGAVKADGSFQLPGVAPGEYQVRLARLPEGMYLKSAFLGDQEALDKGLIVTSASDGAVLTLTISGDGATVEGIVSDENEKPYTGATVVLVPEPARRHRQDLYKSVSSDQGGRFRLTAIAPGEYKLLAWDNVETGAWQDPDFLQSFEDKGTKLKIEARSSQVTELHLLQASESER